MSRNVMIANRLREVLLDGYWIANTNYKEQLLSITWQQAIRKVDDLNTISALTFHVNYYLSGLLVVFENGKLEISDQHSFDVPLINSAEEWNGLLNEFLSNAEEVASLVEQLDDSIFDQLFVEEKYGSYLRNIEGLIEHSYYHLGQIVLIRKMIMEA